MDLPRPLGPFTLLRRLAVGGMAEVYVAKTKGIGGFEKLVAIKVIHPRFSEDDHFVQMLVEEAKLSVLLTHANIAQTFDLGCIDGTYFIVMEFIEGADAYKLLKRIDARPARIPLDLCAYVVSEVCQGLDYAHRKRDMSGVPLDIVHRDISPQNILLSFAGEVKIVDFGIAKAAMRSGQTEVGVIKGKYYYMSPEQAWADPVDHSSDIFSLGIVLHELLTGKMLYDEDNLPRLLDRVRKADIEPPSRQRTDIPPELDAIVMKALAKYPNERFGSAHDFGQALTRFLYQFRPSFTPARLAGMMGQLFPSEIASSTGSVHLPSGEQVLSSISADPEPPLKTESGAKTLDPMKPEEFRPDPQKSVIFDLGEFGDETTSREVPAGLLPKKKTKSGRRPMPPEVDDEGDDDETIVASARWKEAALVPTGGAPPPRPPPPGIGGVPDLSPAKPDDGWEDATVVDADGDILARMREMLERKVARERKSPSSDKPLPSPPLSAQEREARDRGLPPPPHPPAAPPPPPPRALAEVPGTLPLMDGATAELQPSWPPAIASHAPGIPDLSTGTWEPGSEPGAPGMGGPGVPPAFSAPAALADTYEMKAIPAAKGSKVFWIFATVLSLAIVVGAAAGYYVRSNAVPPLTLTISSRPSGASLELNGRPLDSVTPTRLGDVEAGTYEVRAFLEGYESETRTVAVTTGPVEVVLGLTPQRRDLILDSQPSGLEVSVDGVSRGRTPTRLAGLPLGRAIHVEVRLDRTRVVARDIDVTEDLPETLTLSELSN